MMSGAMILGCILLRIFLLMTNRRVYLGMSLRYVGTLHLYINRLEDAERYKESGIQHSTFYFS